MLNDFAIYIISHERADNLKTYDLLSNMTSYPLYIVVDDNDSQLDDYNNKYSNVVVFNKLQMLKQTDTLDNFGRMNTPVYSRNFCINHAKRMGYSWILMIDDDISSINYRFEMDGHLLGVRVLKTFDELCEAYVLFGKKSNSIKALAFFNAGGLIGGLGGKYSARIGKTINQAMFLSTDISPFRGTMNEDFNICLDLWNRGDISYEMYDVAVTCPARGTNSGGIKYTDMYVTNFYSLIVHPSGLKIVSSSLWKSNKFLYPEVISKRWKK